MTGKLSRIAQSTTRRLMGAMTAVDEEAEVEPETYEEEINVEQLKDLKMSKFKSENSILEPDPVPADKLDEDEVRLYRLESLYLPDDDGAEEEEMDRAKLAMEEQEMAEEELFAHYRRGWESTWGGFCGLFQDMTSVSPMHFTHCTPGRMPIYNALADTTLQILSIKVAEIKGGLDWPLYVYGVVAARDIVDRNRNLLFRRDRSNCQILTEQDPFLHLTGPSRAIVATDPVEFEIQLKVKSRTDSRDRALMSNMCPYTGSYYPGLSTTRLKNHFCTTELSLERFEKTVQATILGVRVVQGGSWPFKYGGRVACSSPSREVMVIDSEGTVVEVNDPPSRQVVLLDSKDVLDSRRELVPKGSAGYLHLSRHVVSVELRRMRVYNRVEFEESLKVVIQAYSPSGDIAAQGHVYFIPKHCKISQDICDLGDSKVEITVAWSFLIPDKQSIAREGWVDMLDGVNLA